MLYYLFTQDHVSLITFIGIVISFILTFVLTMTLKSKLPTDIGRAFAVNALAAKGKPRGAGIIFVCVVSVLMLIFMPFSIENAIYSGLLLLAMISGFLDDASRAPWGELKKGLIDLLISFLIAFTFVIYIYDLDIHFQGVPEEADVDLSPLLCILFVIETIGNE